MKENDLIQHKLKPEVKAKVNWCVEGEAGVTYTEPGDYKGGSNVVSVEDFNIIVEASLPLQTAQERAAGMTVEELRSSLEKLRSMRARPAKTVRSRAGGREISPSDPLALALTKLSPEKLAKLKEKLGLP